MSHRYAHTQTVVLLMVIAVGSTAMARQARQPAAPAQVPAAAGQGNANLNVAQMPTPVIGKPFRFSLCSGELLDLTAVSRPCGRVTFRLQNGSFLPPGLHLDGFGVISGTTNVDVSKLSVRICAIQIGAYGTNFNCQGQPVGFAGGKAAVLNPPPAPPAAAPAAAPAEAVSAGGGGGGAATMGLLAAGAAAAGGYYLYQQAAATCTEPPLTNFNACSGGSCSGCAAMIQDMVPFCDCVEAQEASAAGLGAHCRDSVRELRAIAAYYQCVPEVNATPVPKPAIR